MKADQMHDKIEETIRAIKSSYGDKYSERDYTEFKTYATAKAKTLKDLITMVENMFDLDRADAKDMVM